MLILPINTSIHTTTYKPMITVMNKDNSILRMNTEDEVKYYLLEKKRNKLLVIKEYE